MHSGLSTDLYQNKFIFIYTIVCLFYIFQWEVDSAALGSWHIGKQPDHRARDTLKKMGLNDYVHRARQVCVPFKVFRVALDERTAYHIYHEYSDRQTDRQA